MVKRAKTDRDAHFRDGSSVHAQALSNHSQHWYEALSRSPGAHFDWPRPFAQVSETVAEMQTWLQIMAQMSLGYLGGIDVANSLGSCARLYSADPAGGIATRTILCKGRPFRE